MRLFLLVLLLLTSFVSFSQEKYSPEDRTALEKNKLEEEIAVAKTDRALHYRIGLFYEQLYKKYGDATIYDAIRNYQASTSSEGDLFDQESYLAAFRLGEIYAKGQGVRMNINRSLFFYMLSDSLGKAEFDKLRRERCEKAYVWNYSNNLDTLQVIYSPFCPGSNLEVTAPLLNRLKASPEMKLHVQLHYPEELSGVAYYYFYNTRITRDAVAQAFFELFYEHDIDHERLVLEQVQTNKASSHWMELVVK